MRQKMQRWSSHPLLPNRGSKTTQGHKSKKEKYKFLNEAIREHLPISRLSFYCFI